jgi:hypothetical protein
MKDKYIAERLGLCWHEIVFDPTGEPEFPNCKHCGREDVPWHWEYPEGKCKRIADENPDFSDPAGTVLLLGLMKAKYADDEYEYSQFMYSLDVHGTKPFILKEFIDLITTPGAMRDAVYSWLKGKEGMMDDNRRKQAGGRKGR